MKVLGAAVSSAFILFALSPQEISAAVITFQGDLAGFNAAAGSPPVSIDFDAIAPGTNIAGSTIAGVTFTSPPGNTLEVVEGLSTFTPPGFTGVIDAETNKLFPTSGDNVLSPGGEELVPGSSLGEKDSLQLDFASPLAAFGMDILFQSYDFATLTNFQVFGATSNILVAGSIVGSRLPGGAPGDSAFIGFVSDDPSTHISRIVFTDVDGNAAFPDSNIGYDTLRFRPAVIPEPSTLLLFAAGLALLPWIRRAD